MRSQGGSILRMPGGSQPGSQMDTVRMNILGRNADKHIEVDLGFWYLS